MYISCASILEFSIFMEERPGKATAIGSGKTEVVRAGLVFPRSEGLMSGSGDALGAIWASVNLASLMVGRTG